MADFTKYNKQAERLDWFKNDMPIVPISDLIDKRFTIKNYGFINTKNGRTCVAEFNELPGRVVFMTSIIAEIFEKLDADGVHEQACDGDTAVTFISRKSGNGREYFNMVFVK